MDGPMTVFNVDFHAYGLISHGGFPNKIPPPPRCQRSAASRCLKARTLWFVCLFGGEKFFTMAIVQPTNLSNQPTDQASKQANNQPI